MRIACGIVAGLVGVVDTIPYVRDTVRGTTRPHLAGAGVAAWFFAEEPVVATAGVIVADLLAVAMVVPKVTCDPESETLATYVHASVCGAPAVGAVGALDLSLLAYPVSHCLVNAALATLIYRRARAPRTPRSGACWWPWPCGS
jgi:hypothetical protein